MLYKHFLSLRRPCPFCSARERMFAEKKTAYLTYAIAPYAKYHLLVVPKRHVTSLDALRPREEKDIADLVKLGVKILKKLKIKNVTSLVRNGGSMKSVAHVHYHIIPNHRIGDFDIRGKKRRILTDKETEVLAQRIEQIAGIAPRRSRAN